MNSMYLWYALGILYIRTDAMNAISDIDYQFTTYTPHVHFTQMMSNPLYYKIVLKTLFCILNKRRQILLQ